MANFAKTFVSPYNSPTFNYDVSYSQTGRTGTSATYSVTVTARMSTQYDYFGYNLIGTVTINGASQQITFKDNSPTWSGTAGHSYTFNITAPAGGSGGTLNARLQVTSNSGASGIIDTGGGDTVTLSTWNTAPTLTGSVSTSPSGTIPENTSSITVTFPSASDAESGVTYTIVRELNQSGSWATISTNATSGYVDNIGSGNQGQIIRYAVKATDAGGLDSGWIYSGYVTKNVFTTASLDVTTASIAFATTSLATTITTPSNTNGSATFTYLLSCSQVTVYNPSQTTKPTSILVWRTGDATPASTQPYIKFDDIKTATSGSGYKGTFNFTLTTTNAYGSNSSSTDSVPVDITTSPSTFSAVTTSGTYSIGGQNFYIPDRKAIVIDWGDATDPLGGTITYDVQVSYDSGSTYSTIVTGLTSSTYTTTLPQVTSTKQCKFNVIARTSYGTSRSLALATSIDLHYYKPPTIVFDDVVRTQTTATVSGTINYNSSISPTILAVSTVSPSTYYTTSGGLVTALTATTYTSASRTFTATFNIADTVSCNFNFTAQDNGGIACGTTASTQSKSVPVYVPMMAMRSTGVGINAIPDGSNKLLVGGNAKINGTNAKLVIATPTNVEGSQGKISFEADVAQGVQLRYNTFDSTLAPFGLHIERTPENTNPTLLPYLKVDGSIYSGATITSTGDATIGGNIYSVGNILPSPETVYNYSNGILVDLMPSTKTSTMIMVEVTGNGYGSSIPIKTLIQTYHYTPAGTFLNSRQLNLGGQIPASKFMLDGGRVKLWIPPINVYQTISITVLQFQYDNTFTVSNAVEPASGTNKTVCTLTNTLTDTGTIGALTMAGNINLQTSNIKHDDTSGFLLQITGSSKSMYWNTGANEFQFLDNGGNIKWGANMTDGHTWQSGYLAVQSNNSMCKFYGQGNTFLEFYRTGGGRTAWLGHGNGNTEFQVTGEEGALVLYGTYVYIRGANQWVIQENMYGAISRPNNVRSESYAYTGPYGAGTYGANTETGIVPNNTAWGSVGTDSYYWYRVMASSCISKSARETKYEILPFDGDLAYEDIKNITPYAYRHLSGVGETGLDGEIMNTHKRGDLQFGIMADTAPLGVSVFDTEGGTGTSVDLYSWTTYLAGALKTAITKIETLEQEVESLKGGVV